MNQQVMWDAEDNVAFRSRLRALQAEAITAREKESECRSAYAVARRDRADAEMKIRAFLEDDMRPLPLFDRQPDHPLLDVANPHARHYHLLGLESPKAGKVPDNAAKMLSGPPLHIITIEQLCHRVPQAEIIGPIDDDSRSIHLFNACRHSGLRPADCKQVAAVVAEVLAAPEPDHDAPHPTAEDDRTPLPVVEAEPEVETMPLAELDRQLTRLRDMGTMPRAVAIYAEEMDRRAHLDPRSAPLSALGSLDRGERSTFASHEIATVGDLLTYLYEEEEDTPRALLVKLGIATNGVDGLLRLIDDYRRSHQVLAPAELAKIVNAPELTPNGKGRKKKVKA